MLAEMQDNKLSIGDHVVDGHPHVRKLVNLVLDSGYVCGVTAKHLAVAHVQEVVVGHEFSADGEIVAVDEPEDVPPNCIDRQIVTFKPPDEPSPDAAEASYLPNDSMVDRRKSP